VKIVTKDCKDFDVAASRASSERNNRNVSDKDQLRTTGGKFFQPIAPSFALVRANQDTIDAELFIPALAALTTLTSAGRNTPA
jgi:hypothetical protein